MKSLYALLVYALLLPLVLLGCGDTQQSPNFVGSTDSEQDSERDRVNRFQIEPTADADTQGRDTLAVPENWEQTEDPVVFTKYFRAQLLKRFGNIPEVHTVANMELKRRQGPALTHDEQITYLKALYKLSPDERILTALANNEQVRAAPSVPVSDESGGARTGYMGGFVGNLLTLLRTAN